MDEKERVKKHYFEVAESYGYLCEVDRELEFEYATKILRNSIGSDQHNPLKGNNSYFNSSRFRAL